ncbi:MAG: DUF4867 family protein [Anaerolineaceae bacterium]
MSVLSDLQKINPQIHILPVTDPSFTRYGRVLTNGKADEAIKAARKLWVLKDGFAAATSVPEFEADKDLQTTIANRIYGEMPVEVGWVYGRNNTLNALEFHQGSEVHISLEDTIFLVAHYEEIEWRPDPYLDTNKVKAYFAPKGSVTELYTWGLHFVPINASAETGFCDIFTLPRGTGNPLTLLKPNTPDGRILIARNQWLFCHPEAKGMVADGNFPGLYGPNVVINQLP